MPVVGFVERDVVRTLYPLQTQAAFIRAGESEMREFLEDEVFDPQAADGFLRTTTDFALKDKEHSRRVMVLDPLATFFLYDVVWRNRSEFVVPRSGNRRFYGYGFDSKGKEINGFTDYHRFRRARYDLKEKASYQLKADIFNCFNSFYHHKVTSDLRERFKDQEDGDKFSQFLREINGGDSIWCFPQGIYPAKVIGNQYLRFIEESRKIKSKHSIRFVDDIVFFGRYESKLRDDLWQLQEVLGSHYLSLNERKTAILSTNELFGDDKLDEIKKDLLQKREEERGGYDSDDAYDDDDDDEQLISEAEEEYLLDLIHPGALPEDVELGLSLLRESEEAFMQLVPLVLEEAPHLLRELHRATEGGGFTQESADLLFTGIQSRLAKPDLLTSHELFWYVRILYDRYISGEKVIAQLLKILEAPSATPVVRAAVLEIETLKYGMREAKETALEESTFGIATHAVLFGLRKMEKARRNQLFKYVGRAGSQWRLMTKIASKF